VLFGQVHQLTVDAYAVQHAGGNHPDKSVDVHLCGLYLVLVRGFAPARVPPLLQQFVGELDAFPHFVPPEPVRAPTVLDVALCDTSADHAAMSRRWAQAVWQAWSAQHDAIAELVEGALRLESRV
jgi:hypothetical protein